MASSSPAKFLFGFLLASIVLWMLFIFASRMVAWILSRVLGAYVGFRVGGWKCLRDVVIKFKKGPVESLSIGEIKVSLRQSLIKLGTGLFSKDPKLQIVICDIEIVVRPPNKSKQKPRSRKSLNSTSGRGKWMIVANVARFLSVAISDLVLKTPKAVAEVKDLKVDISKDGGSMPNLFVKLHVSPIIIHLCEPRFSYDQSSAIDYEKCTLSSQMPMAAVERSSAPFSCEELLISCEFGHDREAGVAVKNLDIHCGEVHVNLNEAMVSKRKSSSDTFSHTDEECTDHPAANDMTPKKKSGLVLLPKYVTMIPEKVSFSLPKLNINFLHRELDLRIENRIMGIQLRSLKSRSNEDLGENTRLDVQLDFSEIHLLRESSSSLMEIMKVDVVSLVYIPSEPTSPVRAEVDVKLGGTQCNLLMSRLEPWLRMFFSREKKKMVLQEGSTKSKRLPSSDGKSIMWTCTLSAPEMTLILYSMSGSPLYHGCSQSSHVFANNVSDMGTTVHMELGELNLHTEDEYQECLKENIFGVESNYGSIIHIAKVSLDWGKKEMEATEQNISSKKLALSVDISGMGVSLTFKRIESLIWTVLSFQALWKSLSASRKRSVQIQGTRSSSSSGKGARLIQFNLERCSVTFSGEVGLENASIADPKRVNYGSQGGRVVIDVSADGNPRTATIMSTVEDSYKKLNYSISLDIFHLSVCMSKDMHSNQIELERARSIYQEFLEDRNPDAKVVLFDILNAKFVRRPGNHKEISVCSLFSATDVTVRWEPDVHLSLFELLLRIKSVVHHHKLEQKSIKTTDDVCTVQNMESNNDPAKELDKHPKQKKKELIFAVDVEMLTVSAAAGDGVDVLVQVHSIFSENARIGVLFEGLVLSFNGARLLKSSRMQVSRVPSSTQNSKALAVTKWDWVIQGLDFHICLPYRLELRAIDDSIEDMLHALKLITAVKTMLLYPWKKESSKPKKHKSSALGCIRLGIRKLTAEIEEEPIQGWLDEHYHLMRNEFYEQAVRIKYADEIKKGNSSPQNVEATDGSQEKKLSHDSVEFEGDDSKSLSKLREEIYEQSFRSYFWACQNLKPSGGSGACREGFQSGFKPSACRSSLLSISASEFDLTLSGIDGGDDGMIEILKQLDPVCRECDIPFSRLYGQNILLNTGTLVVQLRNYTHPMLWATLGKCKGRVILAQQATYFQPQIYQEVFVGKWRKVRMLRSASGTTPPMKTYSDLPICFQKGEISFGVGYEPAFADVSYAFTVALRRANLSIRNPGPVIQPPKKEKSLPWWDDMRNYIHGKISLSFGESRWHILATADPYEKLDKLQIVSSLMELQQSDGRLFISAKDFKIFVSSLQGLGKNRCLKIPVGVCDPFLDTPAFTLEILMDWECDSGQPLNHFLHALPNDGKTRDKVLDPFRSTSLSLRWNFSLRPSLPLSEKSQSSSPRHDVSVAANEMCGSQVVETEARNPTFNIGAHDLAWVLKFWSMNYLPPHKLRSFSRWPRFGVPRAVRSGNLSLDRVMTEFMLRFAATPACITHVPLADDDPAKGLTFSMSKLKYELCFSRGKQKYTFDSKREPLDLVYQGLDLHIPKAFLYRNIEDPPCSAKAGQVFVKTVQSALADRVPVEKVSTVSNYTDKQRDDGFLLSSDYFTIRRQSPKADPARLLAWQEAGRKNLEMTYVRSEFENGSESDEHARSDQSDDDGYNVVIADNCQRVFVYGLKLLWTIENRDAVWSWVGGLSKAFESPKPSPSCVYTQRKLHQENKEDTGPELTENELIKSSASHGVTSPPAGQVDTVTALTSLPHSSRSENSVSTAIVKNGTLDDSEKEGKRHLMVNVIEPQFNLHSEEANGRFLLAAVSGRVLAQSFHSLLHIDREMIEQALGAAKLHDSEAKPEMQWKRMEFSVMLERVQAHVAPTDVDPGAGLQWLPKVLKSSAKVKRTGALLERVFMPCDMYFRYTRHKGGTPDLKVKPLKELAFNSKDITATMTSRQFQVMLDVLTNLLFARLPKPRKSSLTYPVDDDEDIEEEADEMVPDGVEEVEVAKINLEKREWEQKLLIDDIRRLSHDGESAASNVEKDDLWMINGGKHALVQGLKRELVNAQKSRKAASAALRKALQKAAQLRLMEKEKNKSPSYAMRISLQINKVVWGMLMDGKAFAEAEINDMACIGDLRRNSMMLLMLSVETLAFWSSVRKLVFSRVSNSASKGIICKSPPSRSQHEIYDFDRDYKDIGVACFMTKSIVVRNCLPNAKSDTLLSAWNPPSEWGKNVMLRVDAKQGAPREGNSLLELFQVEIYPLKIHLTETMYRMMWEYLFPEEEQDTQRRQEVWKVTTTAGAKRVKKGLSTHEASTSNSPSTKDTDGSSRSSVSAATIALANNQTVADPPQASRQQNFKENLVLGSTPELRRTSSFDRSWEEDVAESVANDLLLQVQSSTISSSSKGALLGSAEQHDESSKNKSKDSKNLKSGRTSHEDKKLVKPLDEKRTRPRKLMEFHNIKISQVELLLTYEGSRFVVNDLKLLMDTFHRDEFVGTWRRLFSRVKKHIIWGVLKSVTGMQGKKFKEKLGQKDPNGASVPDSDLNFSDNEGGQAENQELYPISWPRRPTDGAGDGFVTSVRGLFNTQRRKAKKFVLRTMRGEADNDRQWSESDGEFHPYARQLTITKATTRLIRRHTKKFRTRQKGSSSQQHDLLPSSPRENMPLESDYSSGSSSYEDFNV